MKKKLLLVCIAILSLLSASAATPPLTSTPGNDVWYYILCKPRSADAEAKWLTGAAVGGIITNTVFSSINEALLWKVIANADGIALVNKQYGTYINADQTPYPTVAIEASKLTCVSSAPAVGLKFAPYFDQVAEPGGFYVVNASATLPISNVANTSLTFQLYSAGSGFNSPINFGASTPNVNSSMKFLTAKDMLLDGLNSATTLLNSTSVGTLPGQFSPESWDGLGASIIEVQSVADNPVSTNVQLLTALSDLRLIVDLFNASVILPQLSGVTDVWYFLQGTRPANTYITAPAAAAATQVKNSPLLIDDTQMWKLVTNGDGFALQNKASLEYLVTDVPSDTNLPTQAAMPTKALRFILSPETSNRTSRFWIENTLSGAAEAFRLHAGGSNFGWGLVNYTGDATDNCTWLFLDYAAAQRESLKGKLTAFNIMATSTQVGTNPGQVTLAGMNQFKAVIATAQATYDNPQLSSDFYIAASLSLETAKATLKTNASLPIISTDASSTYYTMSGTRPAVTSVIANVSSSNILQYQVLKNEDAELWRFVANGTGFAIQNKATNKYIACDSVNYTNTITQTSMPTRPLKFVISDEIAAGAYRFIIENDTNVVDAAATFRLHASAANPMNYADDATDNCGWLLADNSQAIKNAFNAILVQGDTLYSKSAPIEGSAYGQYPASARSAFKIVSTNAKAVDLNAMTIVELQAAYAALITDWVTFQASLNSDINTLVSTAATPKWFYITGCNSLGTAGYNKRIANVGGTAHCVEKADADDNQKWRFEFNPLGDGTIFIINKTANEELTYPGSSSTIFTVGAGGTYFELGVHADGISSMFTIGSDRLHCDGSLLIVGWYDETNPNSAWRFDATSDNTSVKELTVRKLNIRSNNGIITVDGVDNFEVFSVMGQRLNVNAVLNKGVYIIKTKKITQKYIVR